MSFGADEVEIRVSGPPDKPALIYLPGLHGDWTLVGSFKAALADRVRFVEITYPHTTTWTLREYALGVLAALASANISHGWLLGESFGSQVVWEFLSMRGKIAGEFAIHGVILSGGFVRHPIPSLVSIGHRINRAVPMPALKVACQVYGIYAKLRHRRAPETLCCINEFVARRTTEADRQALTHRYTLIRGSDFCEVARRASVPVYQLSGFFDPIVPWPFVRRWLKRHCPSYAGWRLIWAADHNVLGTAPAAAARQVVEWMTLTV